MHSHIRYTRGKATLKGHLNLHACDGKCLKNNNDTNNTFADPMVRVEALSTAGQTVALLQNLRVDAGCTVRGPGSGAACTRVMTD